MTVESNDTHTSCSCFDNGLTRYTLASSDEKPPVLKTNMVNNDVVTKSSSDSESDLNGLSAGWTFVLAVVASSISLVVVVAAAALIIVYCKRVKVINNKKVQKPKEIALYVPYSL